MIDAPTTHEPAPTVGRLAGNTLVQVGGNFAASAIGFLTFVAVTRGLGSEGFGALTTALVFLMLPVILADVGLSTALLREISARPERTEPAMRAALPLRAGISALAVTIAVGAAYVLPFSPGTKSAIAIGSVGAFCSLMSFSLIPVLQARLRMEWAILGTIAGRVLTLVATLLVLRAGLGLEAVMAANVLGLALMLAIHLAAVGRMVSLRPTVDVAYWKGLVRGSIVIGLALAVGQIYFRIDMLLVAAIRGPAEVGLYGAAFKFIELADLVGAAVGISIFPLLTRLVATDQRRARALLQRIFDILLATAAPIFIVLFVRSTELILFVSGDEFREGGDALRLLAPYILLSFASGLIWRALMAWGDDLPVLAVATTLLAVNVALNLVLVPRYGFRAAAIVHVATEVLAITMLAITARRRHRVVLSLRYLVVVLPAAAAMAAVLIVLPLHVVLAAPLATAVYVTVVAASPGTVRHIVTTSLAPAARRALSARGK